MKQLGFSIASAITGAFFGAITALVVAGAMLYAAFTHQDIIYAHVRDAMMPVPVEEKADLKGNEMRLVLNLANCQPEHNECLVYQIQRYNKERDKALGNRYEREARISLFTNVLNEAARDVQARSSVERMFNKDLAGILEELHRDIRRTQITLNRASMRMTR